MARLPRSLSLDGLTIRVPSFHNLQGVIEMVVSPFSPVSPLQLPIPNFVHEEYQELNKDYVSLLIGTFTFFVISLKLSKS